MLHYIRHAAGYVLAPLMALAVVLAVPGAAQAAVPKSDLLPKPAGVCAPWQTKCKYLKGHYSEYLQTYNDLSGWNDAAHPWQRTRQYNAIGNLYGQAGNAVRAQRYAKAIAELDAGSYCYRVLRDQVRADLNESVETGATVAGLGMVHDQVLKRAQKVPSLGYVNVLAKVSDIAKTHGTKVGYVYFWNTRMTRLTSQMNAAGCPNVTS